ncbi:RND family efflux transporter MFP subunit [Inquilinus ginsengisoli]|uniref:RND family efflux transporter MFP subunit n=1 Tax=Inquilinus ginsengisoli TaxID=363840 RepID=A0ABU1JTT8_9PROT|nr:efflux RND transporter periplasmic adaptor subunit [Inquilinus ginsengisoli]MDR6291000.1 RND family efflux transporter MFP subunit [Inquilinus ginsengisoli]
MDQHVPVTDGTTEAVADTGTTPRRRWIARGLGATALVAVGAAVGFGLWNRSALDAQATTARNETRDARPLVRTVVVTAVQGPKVDELPGTTSPFASATVFARATGYVATRNVDIGSHVKAGDVLAVIAAPDLDQQLAQAQAQLAQSTATLAQDRANQRLADVTNQRTTKLVAQGWATKEQGDTDSSNQQATTAAVAAAQASITAQQADVSRLEQLTGFEKVVAPFDGVVSSRNFDVGTLTTADSSTGTSLLSIVQTNTLRIQIFVPQEDYFALKDGEDAAVTVPQLPGRVFHGRVARTAGALQPGTRTLLAEVDVDNADGALTAGLYCIVKLDIPRASPVIVLPSQAVIFDEHGLSAAVDHDGTVQLRHLDVLADNGSSLDIRAGLNEGDQVILNPPVNVVDGMRVQAQAQPAAGTAKTS